VNPGVRGPAVTAQTGIAAIFDGVMDQILYQTNEGTIQQATDFNLHGSIDVIGSVGQGVPDSPISVTSLSPESGGGAVVVYQSQANDTLMSFSLIADSGSTKSQGVWKTSEAR
jgi:hypothetical protein